jgi:RND family efflux transporter MFP subunit
MDLRAIIWRGFAILGLAIVAISAAMVGYSFYFKPPIVKTSVAKLAPVSEVVYGTGVVEPLRWAKVVPLQRKRVTELCRCEGQLVSAGQVLGRQDDAEERATLRELEIRRDQLERNLRRAEDDRKNDKISKSDYEQRETQLKEANSRINTQNERLNTLVFRAPLDGMVLRRDGEVGEIVGPTDVLFWVGRPTPMQVVTEINEEEITKVAIGQKAFLRNDAFSQALPATVMQITPKGDPTRKTFRIYLLLPDNTPLQIGMTVEANVVFREKPSAVVVPTEALIGNSIQVVSGGKVRRILISAGVRGARYVEILGNVVPGTVVLSPARVDLADGTSVGTETAPVTLAANAPAEPNLNPSLAADSKSPAPVTLNNNEDVVIAAAMSAHIQSVVNDARKNVNKYREAR